MVFFQKKKVFVALKKAACSIDSNTLFFKLAYFEDYVLTIETLTLHGTVL